MSTGTGSTLDGELAGIVVRRWDAAAPTRVIVLVDGYGEYGARHEHVAERLAGDGAVVYAPDPGGHGGDIAGVVARARDEQPGLPLLVVPGLPLLVLGPSAGGIIAAQPDEVLDELAAFVDNLTREHEAV